MPPDTPVTPNRRKAKKSAPVSVTVGERSGHSEQVLSWRKEAWQRLGFSHARATFLADTHIDLGEARKMHAAGCSHDLLEEILLGTCFAGEDERWYEKPKDAIVYEEDDDGA